MKGDRIKNYRLFNIKKGNEKMRINDYEHLFRLMLGENLKDSERYVALLKVIGNNSKYDFNSQVSIVYHRCWKSSPDKKDDWCLK